MILVAYRHGLRASEVCDLQWHQVELDHGRMHVRRAKNGTPSVHPIRGDEIRALRKLRRDNPNEAYVFLTERGGPMSTVSFTNSSSGSVRPPGCLSHCILTCCGMRAAISLPTTGTIPEQQHYLGLKNIQHTVRCTELSSDRFRDFWRD